MNTSGGLGATALPKRGRPVVLASLMLVMSLAALDQNIVNTALPRITADLGGADRLAWVVSAFLLTSTISTPLYGKFADMAGRRRTLIVSLVSFLAASAACGLAQTMSQLISFRALQGLGAGGLMTLSLIVLSDVVAPVDRPRYQGLFMAAYTISSIAGPLLGGALTTALSWRWVFYVNIPLGGLALILIGVGLRADNAFRRHSIDFVGAVLLAATTSAFLLLLTWALPQPGQWLLDAGLAGCSIFGLLAFLRREARAPEPILSLDLFGNRRFAVIAGLTACLTITLMGALVFIPLYLQLILGQTPFQAGLITMPQVIGVLLSSVLGGHLISRVGRIKPFLLVGVIMASCAVWVLAALIFRGASPVAIAATVFVLGVGAGFVMPNVVLVAQNAVDDRRRGEATGAVTFVRTLGLAVGAALSGGVVATVIAVRMGPGAAAQTAQIQQFLGSGGHELAALASGGHALLSAYRLAIGASLTVSAVVLTGSIALAWALPDDRLAAHQDRSAPAVEAS